MKPTRVEELEMQFSEAMKGDMVCYHLNTPSTSYRNPDVFAWAMRKQKHNEGSLCQRIINTQSDGKQTIEYLIVKH